jgi:septal ring factor EnvC (AmiA/AmiB activator)
MNTATEEKILNKLEEHDKMFADLMVFLRDNVATKEDIKDMVTKNDIKDMATKGDIKDMATKGDLAELKAEMSDMKSDIKEIKADIRSIKSELRSINERIDDLEKRLSNLEKMTKEDLDVLVKDFIQVKNKVNIMEEVLKIKGILTAKDLVGID